MQTELELRNRKETARKNDLLFDDWLKETSPHYNWDYPHLIYIRKHLQPIIDGEQKHLIIMLPPQHGKSLQVTTHLPAFLLNKDPRKRIIIGAYNHTYATDFSLAVKRILRDKSFKFGEKSLANNWETTEGGFLKAFGLQSGITGTPSDLTIIDDPIKNYAEAYSKVIRDKIWNGFVYDIETREQKNTSYIIILTHWHSDDIASRLIARDGAKWDVISLPAIAYANDPLGRKEGEALCEGLHTLERLLEIKEKTPTFFSAMYQQMPTMEGGNIIKMEYWNYYKVSPQFKYIVQCWDTAFKTGASNDYSVCITIGEGENGYYILDVYRKKLQYPELKRMVEAKHSEYMSSIILIEDKASGQSLVQDLERTKLPIKPIGVDKDKVTRVNVISGVIESGSVFLPETATWLADFYEETTAFPTGDHDDIIDSLSMALTYLVNHTNNKVRMRML